jgi:hypothetical protein
VGKTGAQEEEIKATELPPVRLWHSGGSGRGFRGRGRGH